MSKIDTEGLISRHGPSRTSLAIAIALGLMFTAVGILLLALISNIGTSVKFEGNINVLYATTAGAFVVAIAIIVVGIYLNRRQPMFYLYEDRVRVIGPKLDRTDRYTEIEDIFAFPMGGVGYRKTTDSSWAFSGYHTSKDSGLVDTLCRKQVEHRLPAMLDEIHSGRPVVFRYFNDADIKSKTAYASRKLDYPTNELSVTSDALTLSNKTIPLDAIHDINANWWIESMSIKDEQGNVVHQLHPSAILSVDLLFALLAHLKSDMTPTRKVATAYLPRRSCVVGLFPSVLPIAKWLGSVQWITLCESSSARCLFPQENAVILAAQG